MRTPLADEYWQEFTRDASECIRPGMLTPQDTRRFNGQYVTHYRVQLYSAIGFVALHEMLACPQL